MPLSVNRKNGQEPGRHIIMVNRCGGNEFAKRCTKGFWGAHLLTKMLETNSTSEIYMDVIFIRTPHLNPTLQQKIIHICRNSYRIEEHFCSKMIPDSVWTRIMII